MKRQFATMDVLAVAISAFEFNDRHVHRDPVTINERGIYPNRQLINEYLEGKRENLSQTVENTEAENLALYLQQSELVQTLTGRADNFLHQLNELLSRPVVTYRDFGIMAWAPKLAHDLKKKEEVREVSSHFEHTSRYFGKLGEKLLCTFTLIESRYVKTMDCYAVFGHNENNDLVFYWVKDKEKIISNGRIQGRVKAHKEDKYHGNACVTTLNYVKVLE